MRIIDVTGDEAQSNSVTTGSAITPPYSETFDLASSLDLYTIVDANSDKNTWYYSLKSAKYRQSTSKSADDYLFMPPFSLKAGYSYELTFDGSGTNTRYTNRLDVVIGDSPDANSVHPLTEAPLTYSNDSRSVTNNKLVITPETDGKYYIGFHLVSDKSQGTFTIDNVKLSAGKTTAVPAAPEAFTVTPGEKGALAATIAVTAPTHTAAGQPLDTDVIGVKIACGDREVYSGTVAPGSTVHADDNGITENGKYKYSVSFSNSEGNGEVSATEVFIGTDTPTAPTDVVLTDNNNGKGTVSWTAPSQGVNGGYVDEALIVYTIIARDGSILSTGIKGTSAEIDVPAEGKQAIFSVKVAAAYTDNATSPAAESGEILAGAPYSLPYAESFAGAAPSTTPWTNQTVSGKNSDTSWSARPDQTQDNDGGAADMTAYAAASSRWAGPKIDISGTSAPQASVYVFLPDGNTRFTLQLQKDNGEWIDLTSTDNAADDWVLLTAPLKAHKSSNVRLGLLGECLGDMHFIYADNIKVVDTQTGVDEATADTPAFISARDGMIVVASDKETAITVHTVDGRLIANVTAANARIAAAPGSYIVKAGNHTAKIIL